MKINKKILFFFYFLFLFFYYLRCYLVKNIFVFLNNLKIQVNESDLQSKYQIYNEYNNFLNDFKSSKNLEKS